MAMTADQIEFQRTVELNGVTYNVSVVIDATSIAYSLANKGRRNKKGKTILSGGDIVGKVVAL